MQRGNLLFTKFIALTIIFSSFIPTFAQTKRPVKTVTTVKTNNQKETCESGWSGIITFQKTHNYTYNSAADKNVTTVRTRHLLQRDYSYKGRIVVDGSDPRLPATKGQVSFTDARQKSQRSEDTEDCRYDNAPPIPVFLENKESETTNAFGEGAGNFHLMVNPATGIYSFNFRMPEAKGVTEIEGTTTAKQCIQKNYPPTSKKLTANVPGTGAGIDNQLIDPKNPDVLSGSKTWETGSTDSTRFQHTVTWAFKRCPSPIEVTAIEFDEHPYVNPWHGDLNKARKTWRRITKNDDTIDGNIVRIRARVVNFSGETKFPTIKFHEMIEKWELPGETSVRLEAGEEKEISIEWDTSGYAWQGKGWTPMSDRKIKVEAISDGKTSDLTETIVVSPRPVVLVHGLWATAGTWNEFKTFFREGHSAKWESFAVGEDSKGGKMQTGETVGGTKPSLPIAENSTYVLNQIEIVREKLNAWHVDLVAHSMGGLISRYYIDRRMPPSIDEKPVVTRLLMLGTPNMGSPCADMLHNSLFKYGNGPALYELKPSVVAEFNKVITERRGVRFSSLVGKAIPKTCQRFEGGDGVVPISSAIWEVHDWRYSPSLMHTNLTSHADFGGFVFPRLAIGPRGNHDIELVAGNNINKYQNYAGAGDEDRQSDDRYGFNHVFQKASYKKQSDDNREPEGLITAREVKLQPNQSTEIEVPVVSSSRISIVFAASPNVSATLLDSSNKIIAENKAGTPESKQMFRTISLNKAVSGQLRLKFESREIVETTIYAAALAETNPVALTVSAGKSTTSGQLPLQAKLTNNNVPVTGAIVKATIKSADGKTVELNLLDDGKNGDSAAGDGVYGANPKLEKGDYLIETIADFNGQKQVAVTSANIGSETRPAAQVGKQKK